MEDLERKLRELGESTGELLSHPAAPASRIVRRARVRRVVAGLGSVGLVVMIAAGGYVGVRSFGGDATRLADDSILATAAETTEQQGSARSDFEMTMRMEGAGRESEISMSGSGEIDFEAQRSHMRLDMQSDIALGGAGTMEMIQEGTTIYTRGALMGESDKWLKQDLSQLSGGVLESASGQPQSPNQYLDQLKAEAESIEILGDEEMDGVTVTHYRAIIDPYAAMSELETSSEFEALMENMELEFDPTDVWVDAEGRVRKMASGIRVEASAPVEFSMDMDFAMRLYDFGVPVDIGLPDPGDVTEQNPFDFGDPDPAATATDGLLPETKPIDTEGRTLLVTGKDGPSGPTIVIFPRRDPHAFVCVVQVPGWLSRASVIEESSRDIVVEVEFEGPSPSDEFDTGRTACSHDVDAEALHGVVADPRRYFLEMVGGLRVEKVPLTRILED